MFFPQAIACRVAAWLLIGIAKYRYPRIGLPIPAVTLVTFSSAIGRAQSTMRLRMERHRAGRSVLPVLPAAGLRQ